MIHDRGQRDGQRAALDTLSRAQGNGHGPAQADTPGTAEQAATEPTGTAETAAVLDGIRGRRNGGTAARRETMIDTAFDRTIRRWWARWRRRKTCPHPPEAERSRLADMTINRREREPVKCALCGKRWTIPRRR